MHVAPPSNLTNCKIYNSVRSVLCNERCKIIAKQKRDCNSPFDKTISRTPVNIVLHLHCSEIHPISDNVSVNALVNIVVIQPPLTTVDVMCT